VKVMVAFTSDARGSPFEVVMYGHQREWLGQEGACRYLEEGRWEASSDAVHRSYEEFKRREKCETRS
jgi:hypothetical protein